MVMNAADNEPSAALYYIITLKSSLVKVGRCRIHGTRLDNLSAICYTCREKQKRDVCGMSVNVRLKIKATVTDLELAAKYMHAVRDGFSRRTTAKSTVSPRSIPYAVISSNTPRGANIPNRTGCAS